MGFSGFGLGFRPAHYRDVLAGRPEVDFFEVISENFLGGGRPRRLVRELAERYPVVMHGVSLSIGSQGEFDPRYLRRLKNLADELATPLISDHLCWTALPSKNSHDLLPLPYTEESYRHVAARVQTVQEVLQRQLLLENPSAYVAFAHADYSEAEFLDRLCRETGCAILLDVNNLYVNTVNLGIDPVRYLNCLARGAVKQFHLAGHSQEGGVRIDTHDHPVLDEVWALYRAAVRLFPKVPTLLEWDDKLPALSELLGELDKARVHKAEALGSLAADFDHGSMPLGAPCAKAVSLNLGEGEDRASRVQLSEGQEALWRLLAASAGVEGDNPDLVSLHPYLQVPRRRGAEVYNWAYFSRLRDVAATIYPALAMVTGERFGDLFGSYLAAHPSQHYCIEHASDALPDYLYSEPFADDEFGVPAFVLGDICKIEQARHHVYFDDDSNDVLSPSALFELSPDAWFRAKFRMVPAMRLLSLRSDALSVVQAVQAGSLPEPPDLGSYWVLVCRVDEEPRMQALAHTAGQMLQGLLEGKEFAAAINAAIPDREITQQDMTLLMALLVEWAGLALIESVSF